MAYNNFSEFYDLLMENADYDGRADYYKKLLSKFGIDSGILLDLGCGTGSMSVKMSKLGYDVIGVDCEIGMLNKAREKAAADGENILFLNQFMQHLDLFGTVDCCISTLDCLNHIDEKDLIQSIEKVSLFMNPNGIFCFDINTIFKHKEILGDNTFVYDLDEVYAVWQNDCYNDKDVDISLDFFVPNGDNYERFCEDFTEYGYEIDFISSLLEKCGFEIVGLFEDMTFSALKPTSEKAVFVARKVN